MLGIDLGIILSTFLIVFVAELGDKTQLVAFSLTSTAKHPVLIFIATSLALTCSSVLAALLGGVASQVLGIYTSFIAVALFFGFGFYILFSKEAPPVKECFLKTIAAETALLRLVPPLFKRAGFYDHRVMNVMRQESGHALVFRTLLREKRLFKDDINEEKCLADFLENIKVSRKLLREPFPQALEEIIRVEEAVRDMYRYFHDHLSLEHHAGEKLHLVLAGLVEEESEHIAFFKGWRGGGRP